MFPSNSYDRINASFELAVTKIQENLQYLVDNDKVSNQFIVMQNLIIKNLIDFQHKTETYISVLEMENMQLANCRVEQIEKLKDLKESFEAICIIHGIMDFPVWLNKGNRYLVYEVIKFHTERAIALPHALRRFIDKLTDLEKQSLKNILSINFNDPS